MTACAETVTEPDGDHLCLNGRRCVDKVDDHARETEKAGTFCEACMSRAAERVGQLPEQYVQLHRIIGDRHAGVDVNIRHAKPSSTVLLNLHVDSLMGHIVTDITAAAEVVAEKMAMRDADDNPWEPDPADPVKSCATILNTNLPILASARGIGGREPTDPLIDVMFWNRAGTLHGVKATTGIQMIQRLDHLSSLAYFTLGQTRARYQRDVPCTWCRAKTVGRWAGADEFDCTSCGKRFPEDDMRRQDVILLELYRRGLLKVGNDGLAVA